MDDLRDKVQHHIRKNKTKLAIEELLEYIKEYDGDNDTRNLILILNSRNSEINKREISGSLSQDELKTERNSINSSILKVLDLLDNEFFEEEKDLNIRNILFGISAILAICLAVLAYNLYEIQKKYSALKIAQEESLKMAKEQSSLDEEREQLEEYVYWELDNSIHKRFDEHFILDSAIASANILGEAERLVQKIENVDHGDFDQMDELYKNIGILDGYHILVLISSSEDLRRKYCEKGLKYAEAAEKIIKEIENSNDLEGKKNKMNWIIDQNYDTKLIVEKFILESISSELKPDSKYSEKYLKGEYKKLADKLNIHDYTKYPIIKKFSELYE